MFEARYALKSSCAAPINNDDFFCGEAKPDWRSQRARSSVESRSEGLLVLVVEYFKVGVSGLGRDENDVLKIKLGSLRRMVLALGRSMSR